MALGIVVCNLALLGLDSHDKLNACLFTSHHLYLPLSLPLSLCLSLSLSIWTAVLLLLLLLTAPVGQFIYFNLLTTITGDKQCTRSSSLLWAPLGIYVYWNRNCCAHIFLMKLSIAFAECQLGSMANNYVQNICWQTEYYFRKEHVKKVYFFEG